jgi:superfamily II DNA or RNA helicase
LQENGDILQAEVITRQTSFSTCLDASEEYSKVLSELCQNEARNRLIARDVATEAQKGSGICLILSDRKSHCADLKTILSEHYSTKAEVLTGDLPQKAREAIVNRLTLGEIKVLIATGQLIGEGFDCKALSTLFMATPVKFNGRVLQYLGRVLRPAPGKDKAMVYDYVDARIGVLLASAKARLEIYTKGYMAGRQ